ncbi:MAG: hypothetical protein AAF532_16720 [Planctomycetota bacterium]
MILRETDRFLAHPAGGTIARPRTDAFAPPGPHRPAAAPDTPDIMAFDAYEPCPCGSGKKLKFCCPDVSDQMEKVTRLRESNQTRAALRVLDKLAETNPDTPWNEVTRATVLIEEGRPEEALPVVARFAAEDPKNPTFVSMHAIAAFAAGGYETSKELVWRAFLRCGTEYGSYVTGLALGVAQEFFVHGMYPAARQHLVLAMRFARPEDRQEVFVKLIEFDSNPEIPYPLRGVHHVAEPDGLTGETEELVKKAGRLAHVGAYGKAAAYYEEAAGQIAGADDAATKATLLADAALCRAWGGEEAAAAALWHEAATYHPDFDSAAELEAYAQLLDLAGRGEPSETIPLRSQRFTTDSVARLLTALDAVPTLQRVPLDEQEADNPNRPSALYEVLDRDLDHEAFVANAEDATYADVPRVLGRLVVADGSGEDVDGAPGVGPRAVLTALGAPGEGLEPEPETEEEPDDFADGLDDEPAAEIATGTDFALARQILLDAAAGLELDGDPVTDAGFPRDLAPVLRRYAYPEKFPVRRRRLIEADRWQHLLTDHWPDAPLDLLGGRTPKEAADAPGTKVAAAAAIVVLDSHFDRNRKTFDLVEARKLLGLPEPVALDPSKITVGVLAPVALERVPLDDLSGEDLGIVLNRVLLVRPRRMMKRVLAKIVAAPPEDVDLARVYLTMTELAQDEADTDAALEAITAGREVTRTTPLLEAEQRFEELFRWDTRELTVRLESGSDAGLAELVQRMRATYGPKLPQFTQYLEAVLDAYGRAGLATAEAAGSTTAGGVWTPDAPGEAAEPGKLWLPGT